MQFIMDPHHQQHHHPQPQPPPPPPQPHHHHLQPQPQAQAPLPPSQNLAQLPLLSQQQPPSSPFHPQPPPAAAAAAPLPFTQIPQYGQVTNSAPNQVSVPVINHPPYAQMITEAIAALNEKEGSSKRAIGKYIERVYANANLPGTHSALLTTHLKRLKEQGNIVMVKHSYALTNSRSVGASPSPPPPNPTSNGLKRRPGRPPKAKNEVSAASPTPISAQSASVDPAALVAPVTNPNTDPVSVFASLGLVDGPVHVPVSVGDGSPSVKRGRGRPKKTELGGAPSALKPCSTLGKKSPGRPRKVAAKNAINAVGLGPVAVSPRLKADGTPAKPRGRPPKKNVPAPATNASAPAVTGGFLAPAVYVGEGALTTAPPTTGTVPGKRRGRPSWKAQNGQKTPRKLSGKPLGRPRKVVSLL